MSEVGVTPHWGPEFAPPSAQADAVLECAKSDTVLCRNPVFTLCLQSAGVGEKFKPR
jgi:hypothetical protein